MPKNLSHPAPAAPPDTGQRFPTVLAPSSLHGVTAISLLDASSRAEQESNHAKSIQAQDESCKFRGSRGSQSKTGTAAVVQGQFPAGVIMQVFCMYILAFRWEEEHLNCGKRGILTQGCMIPATQ